MGFRRVDCVLFTDLLGGISGRGSCSEEWSGELGDFKGLPSLSSRTVHPNEQENKHLFNVFINDLDDMTECISQNLQMIRNYEACLIDQMVMLPSEAALRNGPRGTLAN